MWIIHGAYVCREENLDEKGSDYDFKKMMATEGRGEKRGGRSEGSKKPHFVELTESLPQPLYFISID